MNAERSVRPGVHLSIRILALLLAAVVPASAATKQEMYGQMTSLAQQMAAIKANPAHAGQYAALAAQYRQLSDAMGGDDPANMNQGSLAAGPQGGAVTLPPNCAGATATTASTNVPVAITDNTASSSTLTVAGANTFLYKIEVQTTITHTFAGDLDITLQSPAGTVVTLTTDNGGSNDDVFAGTVWTDSAGDAVTDHVYANATLASPLVPEEAMSAFYGEDPNGLWTLTISDDATGDTGSLSAWSVTITALAAAPIDVASSSPSTDTPIAITDNATFTSTLAVAGLDAFVCKVGITANITHTFAGDLDISLQSPFGPATTISTDNGGSNDDVFAGTVWDDEANPGGQVPYASNDGLTTDQTYVNLTVATPLVPEGAMGAFLGGNPNGNWVLSVGDDATGDTGTLNSWSLQVTTCSCVIPDADLQVSKIGALGAGSTVIWTIDVTNNGPGNATGVVVTDALDACSTYISDDCGGLNTPPWTWNVGALANGASATCNITVDTSGCGIALANTATATGDQNDPAPLNNSATATLTVGNTVDIPTLDAVGLAAFGLLLAGGAFVVLRRRRAA